MFDSSETMGRHRAWVCFLLPVCLPGTQHEAAQRIWARTGPSACCTPRPCQCVSNSSWLHRQFQCICSRPVGAAAALSRRPARKRCDSEAGGNHQSWRPTRFRFARRSSMAPHRGEPARTRAPQAFLTPDNPRGVIAINASDERRRYMAIPHRPPQRSSLFWVAVYVCSNLFLFRTITL